MKLKMLHEINHPQYHYLENQIVEIENKKLAKLWIKSQLAEEVQQEESEDNIQQP